MQDEAYFSIAHEALMANLVMYYLEFLPAFSLPGLVRPLPAAPAYSCGEAAHTAQALAAPAQIRWYCDGEAAQAVAAEYVGACGRAMCGQTLRHLVKPFRVQQVLAAVHCMHTRCVSVVCRMCHGSGPHSSPAGAARRRDTPL